MLPVVVATVVAGFPAFQGLFAQQSGRAVETVSAFNHSEAAAVSEAMGFRTVDEAVANGYLVPAQKGGYLVTAGGAEAIVGGGAGVLGQMSQAELIAIVAGALGFGVVLATDEDGSARPTIPPTGNPTPTPTPVQSCADLFGPGYFLNESGECEICGVTPEGASDPFELSNPIQVSEDPDVFRCVCQDGYEYDASGMCNTTTTTTSRSASGTPTTDSATTTSSSQ